MGDGGLVAQAIVDRVRQHATTAPDCRVEPGNTVPALPAAARQTVAAPLPPRLKAYLRLGARTRGEPCYDSASNGADILALVKVGDIDASYT